MAGVSCGDVHQSCCAGNTCTHGECKNGYCSPTGIWGWPCDENKRCGNDLTCSQNEGAGPEGLCQNSVQGAPLFGASCFNDTYCKLPGQILDQGMSCIADTKNLAPSGFYFYRCGCKLSGEDCESVSHKGICTGGPQTWDPLTPPP